MADRLHLGLDVGSISADLALLDDRGEVIETIYRRTKGRPWETAAELLAEAAAAHPPGSIVSVSLTGTAAQAMAPILGAPFVNEIIAHVRGAVAFHPQARTIIDMGGEDSKLILLEPNGRGGVEDFAMNSACAAGTGSFLDQQANRLGYTIEEFSSEALRSEHPPRVAGRCSVFAKTDMIHLQQEATPDYDIVAGLCFALIRNLKSNIARGKDITPPVVFQGGVAANEGVRRALREVTGLGDGELIVPRYFQFMGAIGAARLALDGEHQSVPLGDVKAFAEHVAARRPQSDRLERLSLGPHHGQRPSEIRTLDPGETDVPVYLGVDVGSISTNVVLIDEQGRLVAKEYLMTAGRPLEAVKAGLARVGAALGDRVRVEGAGTTGSGRYLTGEFIGADVVRNEITAQATASAAIDPEVDTIFEIGGQDSKFISLKNGAIVDFMMNKVCAAGTGSFLEEQAEKLGLSIREEFGSRALGAPEPIRMGERCTVFMESDIVHHQQQGADVDSLVAGLSYAIVHNYLNKVVEDRPIGRKIFYQGATAQNQGIVAAFEKVTGQPIHVPPHTDVTGAIGVALLAQRERTWAESRFKGFGVAELGYEIKPFECHGCPNRCEVRKVTFEGADRPLFYGSRCDKYEIDTAKKDNDLPDLFALRESWLLGEDEPLPPLENPRGVIGLPRALFFRDMLPYFRAFFHELGYETVVSAPTNKEMIHRGVERIVAETCFPIKVAHGHLLDLIDQGVKTIFLPSIMNVPHPNPRVGSGQICPYAGGLAYFSPSSIDFAGHGVRLVSAPLWLGQGRRQAKDGLKEICRQLGGPVGRVGRAMAAAEAAQDRFQAKCLAQGRKVLDQLGPDDLAMVFVSRSYNGFDPGVNLGLHRKLRDLGVLALPMDFLDVDGVEDLSGIPDMYWRNGQRILSAAKLIKADPRLHAVYVTNFGCGPDSFIIHFFRDYMAGRPYLEIEIDEHSADVGAMTRLEAFLDSIKNVPLTEMTAPPPPRAGRRVKGVGGRTIHIPAMTDHARPFAAALRRSGLEAQTLPESDQETLFWGRKFTSGKECYPCILTTGDIVKFIKNNGHDPSKMAFFMPGGQGPCRFGCYQRYQRQVLDELGYAEVPIFAPNQGQDMYDDIDQLSDLPDDFTRIAWQTLVATDAMQKKLWETRPYEKTPGRADEVYAQGLDHLCQGVEQGREVAEVLKEIREMMDGVAISAPAGSKPVIGVVGEVYTRTNRFANYDVVRQIEDLGGEARVAPFSEWILYVNHISIDEARRERAFKSLLGLYLTNRVQRKIEHELFSVFEGSVNNLYEPTTALTLNRAQPYVDASFQGGEVGLSVGKSIDFMVTGASGVLNVIPFTCMPGTIVHALMKRYREDNGNLPFLTMSCDGQEQTNARSRLEAFMYQVKQFRDRRRNSR